MGEGEGEGEMIWENGIETCIISYMKQIASPGLMHDTGSLVLGEGGRRLIILESRGVLKGSERRFEGQRGRVAGWLTNCVPAPLILCRLVA